MSQLGESFLLCGNSGEHYSENHQKGGEVVRNSLGNPEYERCYKNCQHRIVRTQEGIEPDGVEPCLGLACERGHVQVVDKAYMAEPIDEYEANQGQRKAKFGHPLLHLGFLHLRQLFDLVVVKVKRIEFLFEFCHIVFIYKFYFQFLYGFFINIELKYLGSPVTSSPSHSGLSKGSFSSASSTSATVRPSLSP